MSDKPTDEPSVDATARLEFDREDTDLSGIPSFLRREEEEKRDKGAKPRAQDHQEEVPAPVLPAATTAPVSKTEEASIEDLKRQEQEIQRKIAERKEAEKRAVLDQIITVVKSYEITTEEVVEALGGLKIKRKGVKAKQKYQDPETGVTWSGRGKEPTWIKGKDRKAFLIKTENQPDE